jgi:phospholipid-transporting ATPase
MIAPRLASGQADLAATEASLEVLGSEGLRTLMVAMRPLDEQMYSEWSKRYEEASKQLDGRKEAQDLLSEEIERDMVLVGATAIEDKLQDGVPEAIATLARANLSIYVLTGDKQETAINIGYACSLLTDKMHKMIVNAEAAPGSGNDAGAADAFSAKSTERQLDGFLASSEGATDGNDELALIINGFSLRFALEPEFGLEDKFLALSRRCKSIICCRVTPAQKAQVFELSSFCFFCDYFCQGCHAGESSSAEDHSGDRRRRQRRVDDSGSTRRRWHFGRRGFAGCSLFRLRNRTVSLFGAAAARSRTIQLSQNDKAHHVKEEVAFCFLCSFVCCRYFFFKNVFLVMTQFWFAIFNGFTGQSLFEQWTLAIYNVVFTSIPIIIFACVDEDVSRATVLQNPQL